MKTSTGNLVLASWLQLSTVYAAFNLYPARNATSWAAERRVTVACMNALNQTINCGDGFLPAVMQLEDLNWSSTNLTAGCTTACESGVASWVSNVTSACGSQNMIHDGLLLQPKTLPLAYQNQYRLACMKGGSSGWCWLDNLRWQGSDIIRYPENLCETGDPRYDADVCFTPDFDQTVIEASDQSMKKLYSKSMVCSACFLGIMRQRLLNPLLQSSPYNDYLLSEYNDLQSFCTTSMPVTTASFTLVAGTMSKPAFSTTATVTSSGAATVTTCAGQFVSPSDVAGLRGCHAISQKYNVTTGDLTVITNDWGCEVTQPICLPLACSLRKIDWKQTCESIRASISTQANNITAAQFSAWNPQIVGGCDKLRGDQYVCLGPPGGVYNAPPPVYVPTASTAYYATATPAKPTSSGTIADCGKYYDVASGDDCATISLLAEISFADFRTFNTQINTQCTNLWLGYSYCVAKVTQPPMSTDGSCGPDHNQATCPGSGFGDCCSTAGACGSSSAFCDRANCYSGACTGPAPGVTTNGTCGPKYGGLVCGNSSFGKCCSIYDFCGSTNDYCGAGNCYSGACDPDNGGPSVDGSCGPNFAGNKTCTGTQFGKCCSKSGYCGDTSDYCAKANCYSGACSTT